MFQKRVRGFRQVSKAFGNLMKPEAQVLEITSPAKEIIISIYNQSNLQYAAHGCSEACESCEQALLAVN